MEAGRLFLRQLQAQVDAAQDFAFETTLSGLTYVRLLRTLRERGWSIRLYYLWLPSVALTLRRIAARVKRGGHDIPTAVARRRYRKGLVNLFAHYLPLADYGAIFDNSSAAPVLVYERDGMTERVNHPVTFTKLRKQAGAQP